MSKKAILKLGTGPDANEYPLNNCTISAMRPSDKVNFWPQGDNKIVPIIFSTWSSNDTKSTLWKWISDPNEKKDGSITFFHPTQGKELKTYTFKKAFCVGHQENYAAPQKGITQPQEIIVQIVVAELANDGATVKNEWDGVVE